MFSRPNLKFLSVTLILAYMLCFIPSSPAMAAWVKTSDALSGSKAQLLSLVEREDVKNMISSLGVDPAEAERRVSAMTDEEAKAALDRLGQTPAGGDGAGSLVGALLFIFVLLLITDILGLTHVFPFVSHGGGKR